MTNFEVHLQNDKFQKAMPLESEFDCLSSPPENERKEIETFVQ